MKTDTARKKHGHCSSETSVKILTADFNTSFSALLCLIKMKFGMSLIDLFLKGMDGALLNELFWGRPLDQKLIHTINSAHA